MFCGDGFALDGSGKAIVTPREGGHRCGSRGG